VTRRLLIVVAIVAGMRLYTINASTEAPAPRAPLAMLPLQLGPWAGRDSDRFADDVLSVLGVDDYINRVYIAKGSRPIALYIGYYASQRQGDTIHSPQNCLPGAGWQIAASSVATLPAAGGENVQVNQYLIQKGLDRQVVLYWYQGRGKIIASEYASKLWLMLDAARLHRTDGGLVRVIAPVTADPARAASDAAAFARLLLQRLSGYLP
jgi:EpsI family protein